MAKEMTNLEYAKTLTKFDLPLIIKVATAFINKLVGPNASLEKREKAYVKWCVEMYNPDVWYGDRLSRDESYFYGV